MQKSKIAERYQLIQKCGEGAYGKVYLAKDLKSGNSVAIKKIKLTNIEEGVPISSIREISLLKELNHKNIVRLMDVIHLESKIILVFEYVEYDLKKVLKTFQGNGMEESQYKSLLYQLLKGIQYVHKLKILHRDLKSENLLVSSEGILKIADFGLARGFGLPMKVFRNDVVSLWYRAPDILLGNENYTTSVDMWSVGCIFAEMVNGVIFFQAFSEKDQIKKVFKMLGTPDPKDVPMLDSLPGWKNESWDIYPAVEWSELVPKLSDVGIDLLQKFFAYDPENRISATDALAHSFFDDLDASIKNLYK